MSLNVLRLYAVFKGVYPLLYAPSRLARENRRFPQSREPAVNYVVPEVFSYFLSFDSLCKGRGLFVFINFSDLQKEIVNRWYLQKSF